MGRGQRRVIIAMDGSKHSDQTFKCKYACCYQVGPRFLNKCHVEQIRALYLQSPVDGEGEGVKSGKRLRYKHCRCILHYSKQDVFSM